MRYLESVSIEHLKIPDTTKSVHVNSTPKCAPAILCLRQREEGALKTVPPPPPPHSSLIIFSFGQFSGERFPMGLFTRHALHLYIYHIRIHEHRTSTSVVLYCIPNSEE